MSEPEPYPLEWICPVCQSLHEWGGHCEGPEDAPHEDAILIRIEDYPDGDSVRRP